MSTVTAKLITGRTLKLDGWHLQDLPGRNVNGRNKSPMTDRSQGIWFFLKYLENQEQNLVSNKKKNNPAM